MINLVSLGIGSLGIGGITNDVSADASIAVGYYFYGVIETEAFHWTQADGMIGLGGYGSSYSEAYGVSADGSVIVGSFGSEPFRWTQSDGMISLGSGGSAYGVSADGSIIVGAANGQAFRWTQESGMVGLGSLIGNGDSYANGVSADGSVIVGYSNNANGNQEAFRWTQETGMVSLKETLIGKGLDVSGWTLSSAQAISADGFTIVGNGINPSGQTEAWMANLSPEPIPEPLTILGSIAAIAFAAGFERKFSKNKSEEKDPDD
jgi:probable HAF family extracellular repeat protein